MRLEDENTTCREHPGGQDGDALRLKLIDGRALPDYMSLPIKYLPGRHQDTQDTSCNGMVRGFFENHHTDFKKLIDLKELSIACGFDNGDVYALRTPLSPEA